MTDRDNIFRDNMRLLREQLQGRSAERFYTTEQLSKWWDGVEERSRERALQELRKREEDKAVASKLEREDESLLHRSNPRVKSFIGCLPQIVVLFSKESAVRSERVGHIMGQHGPDAIHRCRRWGMKFDVLPIQGKNYRLFRLQDVPAWEAAAVSKNPYTAVQRLRQRAAQ